MEAERRQRVAIDVHLHGDLATVTRVLGEQGVEVAEPRTASGPLAVLSHLLTPADVPAGSVVRPVVVGSTVVGFHVETSDAVAALRRAVFGPGQQPGRPRGGRAT